MAEVRIYSGKTRYYCEVHGVFASPSVLMRCPICGRDVRMLWEHVITVRDYLQTYIARGAGKTASCTTGPEAAAEACARKLFGDRPFKLEAVGTDNRTFIAMEEGKREA